MFSAIQSQTLVNFVVITKKLFYFYMIASVLDHTVLCLSTNMRTVDDPNKDQNEYNLVYSNVFS